MNKQAIKELKLSHVHLTNADILNRKLLHGNTEYYTLTDECFYAQIFDCIKESLYYIEGVINDITKVNIEINRIIEKRIADAMNRLKRYYEMFVIVPAFQSVKAKAYYWKILDFETELRKADVCFKLFVNLVKENN